MRYLSKNSSKFEDIFVEEKWDKLKILEEIRERIDEEVNAINKYDEMVHNIDNELIKDALKHISLEEKMHLTELYELLKIFDVEQRSSEKEAIEDVEELKAEHE